MEELAKLKEYLLLSINKHGNQPLTLQHLANIIGVIERETEEEENRIERELDRTRMQDYADQCGDRD